MKKLFYLLTAAVLLLTSCREYDDSELVGRVDNLEERVTRLETLCNQMNTNITSLQTIVTALQQNDYITSVTPITEGDATIGYTITFTKSAPITIYHGKNGKDGENGKDDADGKDGVDGKDGYTPVIGVRQDTDGVYYWTLDGEWLLDADGNKIKAVGTDGKDGVDGKDGITPQLKIEDNYWYVSYDNGVTWVQLGKATGEDGQDGAQGEQGIQGPQGEAGLNGDSFFQSVTQDESNVYFTLADGTVITIPKGLALSISFAEADLVVMSPNSTREIGYTVTSTTETVTVEVTSSADIKAKVVADDESGLTGKIHITTSATIDEYSKVIVFVSNGDKVIMRSITFEEAGLVVEENTTKQATAEGGEMRLEFLSNVECEVVIPEDAQDWISVAPVTRAMERRTITLKLEPNAGATRSAEVIVKSVDGKLPLTYTITQEANLDYQLALERAALIEFYKATGGDNWKDKTNWCSDKPLSEWHGIETEKKGRVRTIELPNNNLIGTIPESIGNLSQLQILDLSINELSGNIPASIWNLSKLAILKLNVTQLSGSIPESIGNMSQLQILDLGIAQLSGSIPESIGNLPQLYRLLLYRNQLSGSIPESIGNLSQLLWLSLSDNQLSGNIPESIGKLSLLGGLFLSNNQLSGNIPESIGELSQLHSISLKNNQLSGSIPESLMEKELWLKEWDEILPQKGEGFLKEGFVIPAPKFTLSTIDGNTLSDGVYAKNEYTVLYHYYNWCPYSNMYTPKLVKLYKEYKNKGLEVIAFSDEASTADYHEAYAQKFDTKWPFVLLNSGNHTLSVCGGLSPSINVVDKNGYIVFNHCQDGYNDLNAFLEKNLGKIEDEMYTSTDYSRDGEIVTLQTASAGKGINLTFMGEAFVDKDMGDGGLYEQKMKEAMEKFFSIEPYKSMRNRFNVYTVKVVSPNAEFTEDAKHRINVSDSICFEYAKKIPNANKNPMMVSVIYNTDIITGRSYTTMYSDGSFVGYMMDGITDVLIHEAGGHGFANLLDEYVESGLENSTLSEEEATFLDYVWKGYSWGANVDWRSDASTVKWSHFLNDSRYVYEGLGLHEGAFLYGHGVYRPTENSMMRYNNAPFNAPSREQIYKRIMQLSEGEGWTYDYEEFVKYDEINRKSTTRSTATPLTETERREYIKIHRSPTLIEGTWRDAIKKEKSSIVIPLR